MKKILLLLVILSFNRVLAQSYTPFPDSNAVWVNVVNYYEMGEEIMEVVYTEVDNFCVNGADTIINSYNYTKVNYCNGIYHGAIRDNGGQVFFVPVDSLQEFLLYDFTVSEGSVIPLVYVDYGTLIDLEVYNIDSVLLGGSYRTIVQLGGGEWIEGIGCTQGLFHVPSGNVSGWIEELHCMSFQDTIMFPTDNYGFGQCALDLGIHESDDKFATSIFPNPTSCKFEISGEKLNANSTITIVNSIGQKIDPLITNFSTSYEIDLSNFPNGIYFVMIMNERNFDVHKIVKE